MKVLKNGDNNSSDNSGNRHWLLHVQRHISSGRNTGSSDDIKG